ncbi:MAG: rRNA cytosine-C5-methyltransferase [Bacteroidales bacterium]|nr:rRNA cytosine-C5-methyltransferase [Bacteroidales bacterium]
MVIFAGRVEEMLPEEFLKRISGQSYLDAHALEEALGRQAEVSVRVNPHKWPHPVTGYEKVGWEPHGYHLPAKTLFTPDPLFHAGVYYPQESSGMFTGELFRQVTAGKNDLRVLDLCGAPGGKATHLSALLAGHGLIPGGSMAASHPLPAGDSLLVANEVIRPRAAVLAENITKWGMGNTIVTQNDPSRFASLPGFFDVIVADAPCSGEGMFRSAVAVQQWSVQNTRLCSERQRRIVMEVWPALKPGGILIYSTCTFNPAENEENLSWIRETTGAEPLTADLSGTDGITVISHNGIEGYGFYPGKVRGEGFFIAALRKPAGSGSGSAVRDRRRGVMRQSDPALTRAEPLADFDRSRLIMTGNRIIALAAEPHVLSQLSERLTIVKSGTMIGELKNDDLVPAHDLAMSIRQKRGAWPEYSLSYDEAVSFLRLEQIAAARMPAGRVLVNYRGVPLGFVKNLGKRVNNGYPQSWRIRMEKQEGYREIL